jgi:hypothetical protein
MHSEECRCDACFTLLVVLLDLDIMESVQDDPLTGDSSLESEEH